MCAFRQVYQAPVLSSGTKPTNQTLDNSVGTSNNHPGAISNPISNTAAKLSSSVGTLLNPPVLLINSSGTRPTFVKSSETSVYQPRTTHNYSGTRQTLVNGTLNNSIEAVSIPSKTSVHSSKTRTTLVNGTVNKTAESNSTETSIASSGLRKIFNESTVKSEDLGSNSVNISHLHEAKNQSISETTSLKDASSNGPQYDPISEEEKWFQMHKGSAILVQKIKERFQNNKKANLINETDKTSNLANGKIQTNNNDNDIRTIHLAMLLNTSKLSNMENVLNGEADTKAGQQPINTIDVDFPNLKMTNQLKTTSTMYKHMNTGQMANAQPADNMHMLIETNLIKNNTFSKNSAGLHSSTDVETKNMQTINNYSQLKRNTSDINRTSKNQPITINQSQSFSNKETKNNSKLPINDLQQKTLFNNAAGSSKDLLVKKSSNTETKEAEFMQVRLKKVQEAEYKEDITINSIKNADAVSKSQEINDLTAIIEEDGYLKLSVKERSNLFGVPKLIKKTSFDRGDSICNDKDINANISRVPERSSFDETKSNNNANKLRRNSAADDTKKIMFRDEAHSRAPDVINHANVPKSSWRANDNAKKISVSDAEMIVPISETKCKVLGSIFVGLPKSTWKTMEDRRNSAGKEAEKILPILEIESKVPETKVNATVNDENMRSHMHKKDQFVLKALDSNTKLLVNTNVKDIRQNFLKEEQKITTNGLADTDNNKILNNKNSLTDDSKPSRQLNKLQIIQPENMEQKLEFQQIKLKKLNDNISPLARDASISLLTENKINKLSNTHNNLINHNVNIPDSTKIESIPAENLLNSETKFNHSAVKLISNEKPELRQSISNNNDYSNSFNLNNRNGIVFENNTNISNSTNTALANLPKNDPKGNNLKIIKAASNESKTMINSSSINVDDNEAVYANICQVNSDTTGAGMIINEAETKEVVSQLPFNKDEAPLAPSIVTGGNKENISRITIRNSTAVIIEKTTLECETPGLENSGEHIYETIPDADEKFTNEDDDVNDDAFNEYDDTANIHMSTLSLNSFDDQSDEKKRNVKISNIIKEIVESEQKYVARLKLIDQDFNNELQERNITQKIIPEDKLKIIFINIKSIHELHRDFFLPDLEQCLKVDVNGNPCKQIGSVFQKLGPYFKLYSVYLQEFMHANDTITKCIKENVKFEKFLVEIQSKPACNNLSLQNHMLECVQRIPKYKLLLQKYIQYLPDDSEDKLDAEKALESILTVANNSNELMKQTEKTLKLKEISKMLIEKNYLDSTKHIKLLKEGKILFSQKKNLPLAKRNLLLFNEILFIYRLVNEKEFKIMHSIPIDEPMVYKSHDNEFGLKMCWKNKTFILVFEDDIECASWKEAFQSAKGRSSQYIKESENDTTNGVLKTLPDNNNKSQPYGLSMKGTYMNIKYSKNSNWEREYISVDGKGQLFKMKDEPEEGFCSLEMPLLLNDYTAKYPKKEEMHWLKKPNVLVLQSKVKKKCLYLQIENDLEFQKWIKFFGLNTSTNSTVYIGEATEMETES